MIRGVMLSREELVALIRMAPKTKDGYFFYPKFPYLLLITGNVMDKGYGFDRREFSEKICFSEEDIKAFLSKNKGKYDIILSRFIDTKIQDVLKNCLVLDLKDKIPNQAFTLSELIDTTIHLVKCKYA